VRERNSNNPDNSNNNIGFRVCASHGLRVRPEMSRGDRRAAVAAGPRRWQVTRWCLPKERCGLSLAGGGLVIDNVTGRI